MGSFERTVSVRMTERGASSLSLSSISPGVVRVASSMVFPNNNIRFCCCCLYTLIVYTKSMDNKSIFYQQFTAFSYGQSVQVVRSKRAFHTFKACTLYGQSVRLYVQSVQIRTVKACT